MKQKSDMGLYFGNTEDGGQQSYSFGVRYSYRDKAEWLTHFMILKLRVNYWAYCILCSSNRGSILSAVMSSFIQPWHFVVYYFEYGNSDYVWQKPDVNTWHVFSESNSDRETFMWKVWHSRFSFTFFMYSTDSNFKFLCNELKVYNHKNLVLPLYEGPLFISF